MRLIGSLIIAGGLAFAGQAASSGAKALHIALHDGFNGQTVTISVDGSEVYHRANVRTDLRISRADAFDTEAVGPKAKVEVTVEPGGQRAEVEIDVTATPFLAVDIVGGAIRFTPSAELFRYM
ncbi:MAG TPA: hypothetical protein VEQ35_08375 [Beijerinckia sp.]|jgi:hypothetical protein|nr:hypothetical protein [Beijerinckia sp.]